MGLLLFWKDSPDEYPRKPGVVYFDSFTGGRAQEYGTSQTGRGVQYTSGDDGGRSLEYRVDEDR